MGLISLQQDWRERSDYCMMPTGQHIRLRRCINTRFLNSHFHMMISLLLRCGGMDWVPRLGCHGRGGCAKVGSAGINCEGGDGTVFLATCIGTPCCLSI